MLGKTKLCLQLSVVKKIRKGLADVIVVFVSTSFWYKKLFEMYLRYLRYN